MAGLSDYRAELGQLRDEEATRRVERSGGYPPPEVLSARAHYVPPLTPGGTQVKTSASSPRGEILDEAKGLITGDRNNQYGPPTQDFDRAATMMQAMGYRGPGGRDMLSHDIALMVMMVKMSRITWNPGKRDSWTDIAGYVGCGWECVTEETENGLLGGG